LVTSSAPEIHTSMSVPNSRRLTVADSLICIAGLAIGIWVSDIELIPSAKSSLYVPTETWRAHPVRLAWSWGSLIVRHTQPMAATLTLVLLLLRILKPRPDLRRLTRQPGFTASFAASLAICIGGALNYATTKATFTPGHEAQGYTWVALFPNGSEPGIAAAACWALLVVGKSWRFERTWIDRLGCLLGIYWLIMIGIARLASQH
jgi:hypothetical protein